MLTMFLNKIKKYYYDSSVNSTQIKNSALRET